MPVIQELDYLLKKNQSGVIIYDDAEAVVNNVKEWFATPMGTVAGWSSWGHGLGRFRFHPQDSFLETLVESHIISKMPNDVRGLVIRKIRVGFLAKDLFHAVIDVGIATIDQMINLGETTPIQDEI